MKIIKRKILITFISFLLILPFMQTNAQWENKWMAAGSLHNWFSEIGCEGEELGPIIAQQAGLQWPAEYQYQDSQAAKGLWIGCQDFTEVNGDVRADKVVHAGPRVNGANEFFPIEFIHISKYDNPAVTVDGVTTYGKFVEIDSVDPNLKATRMLYNKVNTQIGITMERKIYQFSENYHDDFIVTEYTYVNTGNIDDDPEIERPDNPLKDVRFFYQYRISPCRETRYLIGNSSGWGVNTMLSARGEPGRNDDDNPRGLRFQFGWHGKYTDFNEYDNLGAPIFRPDDAGYIDDQDSVGRLGAIQFPGFLTLHADKSTEENVDDPAQPSTTFYTSSDGTYNFNNNAFNDQKMSVEYDLMAKGHPDQRHAEKIEPDGDYADATNDPAKNSINGAGYSIANGYGPYQMDPGDTVRLVIVEGAAGLSRDSAIAIGNRYKKYVTSGRNTGINAITKNEKFLTGKDSLIQLFNRVDEAFNYDTTATDRVQWNVPQPPPPPAVFDVTSQGGRIDLSWRLYEGTEDQVEGFELYRTISESELGWQPGTYDTKYKKVADLPADARSYTDTNLIRDLAYYYYIVSVGEEVQGNPALNIPSHKLKSHRIRTQTYEPAYRKEVGAEDLTTVRVVPNPYIISDPSNLWPGEEDKISFKNITGNCTIKIYTELGELVDTIYHNDGSGSEFWRSTTSSNQFIASGVYIAVIEDNLTGEQETVKFVIIR